jgi:hypothetical protein
MKRKKPYPPPGSIHQQVIAIRKACRSAERHYLRVRYRFLRDPQLERLPAAWIPTSHN